MRKLSLKREALVELATGDLVQVFGGAGAATVLGLCTQPTTSDTNSARCQWTFNTCESCWC